MFGRLLREMVNRIVKIRDHEWQAALLSCAFFFCVLCGYYILRPLREEMGLAGGVRNLPYLYLCTLGAMLLASPLFGWLVARFSRRTFIALTYRFFILNLVIFFVLLKTLPPEANLWIGRVFYVWLSVVNMFAVSLFWAFMADGFGYEQSKRLFGFVAIGGALGGILGASITAALVEVVGCVPLLLASAVFFEAAVQCTRWLGREFSGLAIQTPRQAVLDADDVARESSSSAVWLADERRTEERRSSASFVDERLGGTALAGIGVTLRSPYLLGISGYLALYTLTSTFLYFFQANIVEAAVTERAARTAVFAKIDLWVNIFTLVAQLAITSRVMTVLGVGITLTLLPAVTAIGFLALGVAPILPILILFQVFRRGGNYGIVKPARETLFTVVPPEDKYKAKSFIDTFVYRGGDALGSGAFAGLTTLGVTLPTLAFITVPLTAAWAAIGIYLGNKQTKLARIHGDTDTEPPPDDSPNVAQPVA